MLRRGSDTSPFAHHNPTTVNIDSQHSTIMSNLHEVISAGANNTKSSPVDEIATKLCRSNFRLAQIVRENWDVAAAFIASDRSGPTKFGTLLRNAYLQRASLKRNLWSNCRTAFSVLVALGQSCPIDWMHQALWLMTGRDVDLLKLEQDLTSTAFVRCNLRRCDVTCVCSDSKWSVSLRFDVREFAFTDGAVQYWLFDSNTDPSYRVDPAQAQTAHRALAVVFAYAAHTRKLLKDTGWQSIQKWSLFDSAGIESLKQLPPRTVTKLFCTCCLSGDHYPGRILHHLRLARADNSVLSDTVQSFTKVCVCDALALMELEALLPLDDYRIIFSEARAIPTMFYFILAHISQSIFMGTPNGKCARVFKAFLSQPIRQNPWWITDITTMRGIDRSVDIQPVSCPFNQWI